MSEGWICGVDGNHFECNHPPDTRKYTDKGYLIMGNTNKYDEALEAIGHFESLDVYLKEINKGKPTPHFVEFLVHKLDPNLATITKALEKAKAFDQIVEAINYEFRHARHVDNCPYGSDEKHNLKIRATDFWSKINTLCANLTEKYIEE